MFMREEMNEEKIARDFFGFVLVGKVRTEYVLCVDVVCTLHVHTFVYYYYHKLQNTTD